MSDREKLATTLGILIAGMLEAEEAAAESERRPGRTPHKASGVYPIGDALYATDMPPESGPVVDSDTDHPRPEAYAFADAADPV